MLSSDPPAGTRSSIETSAMDTLRAARRALGAAMVALLLSVAAIAVVVAPTLGQHLRPKDAVPPPADDATRAIRERLDRLAMDLQLVRQAVRELENPPASWKEQQNQVAQSLAALTRETEQFRSHITQELASLTSQLEGLRNAPASAPRPARRRGRRR